MDKKIIEAIEAILKCDDRVELIPTKDGVRIYRIRRSEVKPPDIRPASKR